MREDKHLANRKTMLFSLTFTRFLEVAKIVSILEKGSKDSILKRKVNAQPLFMRYEELKGLYKILHRATDLKPYQKRDIRVVAADFAQTLDGFGLKKTKVFKYCQRLVAANQKPTKAS